jgi:hypothetical protein
MKKAVFNQTLPYHLRSKKVVTDFLKSSDLDFAKMSAKTPKTGGKKTGGKT